MLGLTRLTFNAGMANAWSARLCHETLRLKRESQAPWIPSTLTALAHMWFVISSNAEISERFKLVWDELRSNCIVAMESGRTFLDLHDVADFYRARAHPEDIQGEIDAFCSKWRELYMFDLCRHLIRVSLGSPGYACTFWPALDPEECMAEALASTLQLDDDTQDLEMMDTESPSETASDAESLGCQEATSRPPTPTDSTVPTTEFSSR